MNKEKHLFNKSIKSLIIATVIFTGMLFEFPYFLIISC